MPVAVVDSRIVVTIDGFAGSGKSSLAAALAQELQFLNFNSGLLYRTVGHLALTNRVSPNDEAALVNLLAKHTISVREGSGGTLEILLDGKPLTADLRAPEVSEATSQASRFAEVRKLLFALQREACARQDLVAEGRDMGTIVFPNATVKFFVQASDAVRLERRLAQLQSSRSASSATELARQVRKEITDRDERDAGRPVAPTVAASDAVHIDNSTAPLSETVLKMAQIVRARLAKN